MSTEHNPDNLTPEQVGEGWRLLTKEEVDERGSIDWKERDAELWNNGVWESGYYGAYKWFTYRRRITPDAGKAEAISEKGGDEPCHPNDEPITTGTMDANVASTEIQPVRFTEVSNAPADVPSVSQGQQPAEAEADIIDHDWQLLSGARVQCAKCGHLTRASDLAMLSSACTGKAQPASEGQQPAEAVCKVCKRKTDLVCDPTGQREYYHCFACEKAEPAEAMPETETPRKLECVQMENAAFRSKVAHLEDRLTAALAEVERVKRAAIPICVGRPIIQILAKEGQWMSEEGGGVVAADCLFQKDPYQELEDLRAQIERAARATAEAEAVKWKLEAQSLIAYADARNKDAIENGNLHYNETIEHAKTKTTLKQERAVREQAEVEASGLRMAVAIANKSADDQMFQKRAAEHALAESESREHQLRETWARLEPKLLERECRCHPDLTGTCCNRCYIVNEMRSALTAPTSTTVADLRKRAETAERERDAAVKDTKRLDWLENTKAECYSVEGKEQAEGSKLWKIAGKNGFHVTLRAAIDAALATTQETK